MPVTDSDDVCAGTEDMNRNDKTTPIVARIIISFDLVVAPIVQLLALRLDSRLPSYQMSSLSRHWTTRIPPQMTESMLPRIFPAEYIRSLRPEVTIGSRRILNRPSFRTARLK